VKSAPDIVFTTSSPIFSNQEAFLANEKNKKAFVDLLITKLRSHGLTVRQANDDADTVAVSVTIELASNGTDVTVVASDTDIFCSVVVPLSACYGCYSYINGWCQTQSEISLHTDSVFCNWHDCIAANFGY